MPLADFRSPRLFVDAALAAGSRIALDRNQSNYLGNVLRLSAGGAILVFNSRDGEWQATISGGKRRHGQRHNQMADDQRCSSGKVQPRRPRT